MKIEGKIDCGLPRMPSDGLLLVIRWEVPAIPLTHPLVFAREQSTVNAAEALKEDTEKARGAPDSRDAPQSKGPPDQAGGAKEHVAQTRPRFVQVGRHYHPAGIGQHVRRALVEVAFITRTNAHCGIKDTVNLVS